MRIDRLFLLAFPLGEQPTASRDHRSPNSRALNRPVALAQEQELTFGVTGAQLSSASTRDQPARTDQVRLRSVGRARLGLGSRVGRLD